MKQCTVGKLMRIKDDAYLVAVELIGGGLGGSCYQRVFNSSSAACNTESSAECRLARIDHLICDQTNTSRLRKEHTYA
eukprot:scaffold2901_cov91-Skeletonema_dohrnii-CCMP3373.AAC.8